MKIFTSTGITTKNKQVNESSNVTNNQEMMIPFKTMVIFDIETTGLPHLEYGKTKITEMSFVACLISHLHGEGIPRIINKLTLAINPMKMILPESSKITGLENELLEEMRAFDDSVVLILNGFLDRLPQPLCLIAHNGNKFDFPILMKQLLKCSIKLNDNIYCADSLPAFRVILQNSSNSQNTTVEKCMNESPLSESTNIMQFDIETTKRRLSMETTPERKTIPFNAHQVKSSMQFQKTKHSNVSRKLYFDNDIEVIESQSKGDSPALNHGLSQGDHHNYRTIYESKVNQRIIKSYKLIDIYSYLHGGIIPNFHTSESDCMALLSCIRKCKDDFLYWLYNNATLLSDVEPLF